MIKISWQFYLQKVLSISDNFGSTFAILQREREKTETFCDFFEVHPVEPQIKLSFPPPEFSPLNP